MEKASIVEKRLRSLRVAAYSLEARIKDLDGQLLATQRAIALTEDELSRPSRLEVVTFSELEGCDEDGLFCHLPKFLEENGDYFVQRKVSGSLARAAQRQARLINERTAADERFERRVALNGGMPC